MKIFTHVDSKNRDSLKIRDEILGISGIEAVLDICETDITISIGGDGTFLKSPKNLPIIGINTGTLGYLSEISPADIKEAFHDIYNGNYMIEKRMMLEGEIIKRNGDIIEIPPSLNEISLSKNNFGVVRFDVNVNGRLINSYTADGILLCTPTESTAYNLSCGGPIVDPTAEIITVTPIAPHSILNRSIVLSDDSAVEIDITELRRHTSAFVLHDGKAIETFAGDMIRITKSEKTTEIIKLKDGSFIDTIREKIN